jgi:DNA-binding transcriptional regulator LsrR (DeoR family)
MVDTDSARLLYRIAQAYHVEGLTQQQISARFGLSRPKVSRLLQRAVAERIVQVVVVPPAGDMVALEQALEERWGLDEVIVVNVADLASAATVARELGVAAAECLLRSLHEGVTVGIAWGTTILAMVDALPTRARPDVIIVQIIGGLGPLDAVEHSTDLARRVARKLGARLALLPVPGIVSSQPLAAALQADARIAETLALAAQAHVAVVGLGIPAPDSVLLRDGRILSADDLETLRRCGAVGDMALHYLDAAGRPLALELNDRIIGLSLAQIRRIPRVIGVAGGAAKYEIIRAALRGRLLRVLVTDQDTAQRLLADPDGAPRVIPDQEGRP